MSGRRLHPTGEERHKKNEKSPAEATSCSRVAKIPPGKEVAPRTVRHAPSNGNPKSAHPAEQVLHRPLIGPGVALEPLVAGQGWIHIINREVAETETPLVVMGVVGIPQDPATAVRKVCNDHGVVPAAARGALVVAGVVVAEVVVAGVVVAGVVVAGAANNGPLALRF